MRRATPLSAGGATTAANIPFHSELFIFVPCFFRTADTEPHSTSARYKQVKQGAAPFYIAQGRAMQLNPASRENYATEISLFEQALAIDPQSSVAMSRFANAYATRVPDHMGDAKRSDLGRARELVSQAQALSPRAPLTHFVEANRLRAERQGDNAILEYEAGLAVSHHWVGAISPIGRCKTFLGRIDEAIRIQERTALLGPSDFCILATSIKIFTYRNSPLGEL